MTGDQGHEAMLYEPAEEGAVHCRLCGHECLIGPGKPGLCRVRKNVAGRLISLNYAAVVAVDVDPIEKKPLFHFLPGSLSLSVAAAGCNFQCSFCQNWRISQSPREDGTVTGRAIQPADIVSAARRGRCRSISYTYTEPTVFFELAYDTARLAREKGMKNVFVSNGYMTPAAVRTIGPYLDAVNVDLKAFRPQTYRKVMKARLEPVLRCLRELSKVGVWIEVTTLVVPGMNDSRAELADIAKFIAGDLGVNVPWHVSRFHGDYLMNHTPATPAEALEMAMKTGRSAGLQHVYCGNVPAGEHEDTLCPECRSVLIRRRGFRIAANRLVDGRCPDCSIEIAGIWN